MKSMIIQTRIALIAGVLCIGNTVQAQYASDYFSATIGTTWRYQAFVLDSNQVPIDSTKTIMIDSLAGQSPILAFDRYYLVSVTSPLKDTTQIQVTGSTISRYVSGIPSVSSRIIDSIGGGFISRIRGWYPFLQFGTPPAVNVADTLFRYDTTLVLNGVNFPVTFAVTSTRRPVKNVTVPAGSFSSTPFEISFAAGTSVGMFIVPFLKISDTIYVAKNNWIVKEVQQSTVFPLTPIPIPSIPAVKIPGYLKMLEKLIPTGVVGEQKLPASFRLGQNYPNPFNPATTMRYDIGSTSSVTISVYDILGRNVATIAEGKRAPGEYQVNFNGSNLPSGVYLYRLRTDYYSETRKMILSK